MRQGIIAALWNLCGILDKLPGPIRGDDGWYLTRYACYGCYPLGLSIKALALEKRWAAR